MFNTEAKGQETLMLTLTEECNLNCVYCYEHTKDKRRMPVATAMRAIEEVFQRNKGQPLEIQYHGGEPLMAFDNLRKIATNLWAKGEMSRPYLQFATTNGTLVHGDIKKWFAENKQNHIYLGLSLDGTRDMQNKNRSNSFDSIDLDFFLETYPTQPVKMTISPITISSLAEGVIFMQEKGFHVTGSIAQGVPWKKEHYISYAEQLGKLVQYYIEHPEQQPTDMIAKDLFALPIKQDDKTIRWCGTGQHMSCVSIQGDKYPCHIFMPSAQGDKQNQLALKQAQTDLAKVGNELLHPTCAKCAVFSACPTCYGLNFETTGDLTNKGEANCTFNMTAIKASAMMYAHMLANESDYPHVAAASEEKKQLMKQAIVIVDREIPEDRFTAKVMGKVKGLGF